MLKWATFWEILLPSLGNVNDYVIYDSISYEIDCSNYQAAYFRESKRSLKSRSDEHKRSFRNGNCDKNEITKHCWEADLNFNWDQ